MTLMNILKLNTYNFSKKQTNKMIMTKLNLMKTMSKKNSKYKFTKIFHMMENKEMFIVAQKTLNPVSMMCKFQHSEILTMMSQMTHQSYNFNCPYEMKNKIIQEMARMILSSIFEPTFKESSHGFRKNYSTHTAMSRTFYTCYQTNWSMKINMKPYLNHMNKYKMILQIKKRIKDPKFIDMMWSMLNSNFMTSWNLFPNKLSEIPSGTIISPMLLNIYLNEMDIYMSKLWMKKMFKDYNKIFYLTYTRFASDTIIALMSDMNTTKIMGHFIFNFLTKYLKLNMHIKDIHLYCMKKTMTPFIGIKLFKLMSKMNPIKTNNYRLKLYVHLPDVMFKLHYSNFCNSKGIPEPKFYWYKMNHSNIIKTYNKTLYLYRQYFKMTDNFVQLNSMVQFILTRSCAKLLAAKMNLGTMAKVFKKYGKNCQHGEMTLNNMKMTTNIKTHPPVFM
nr:intron-encoded protein-like ORF [Discoporella cookae]